MNEITVEQNGTFVSAQDTGNRDCFGMHIIVLEGQASLATKVRYWFALYGPYDPVYDRQCRNQLQPPVLFDATADEQDLIDQYHSWRTEPEEQHEYALELRRRGISLKSDGWKKTVQAR